MAHQQIPRKSSARRPLNNPEVEALEDIMDIEEGEEVAVNEHGGPPVGIPPKGAKGKPHTWVRPTRFATAYRSIFTLQPTSANIVPSLAMVNCSYLSTKGKAPTLLELKQHAQALTILIKNITMSTQAGLIDNENSGITDAHPFNDGETYDFLNNLSQAYRGPKNKAFMEAHQRPLTSLMNVLEQNIQEGFTTTLPDGTKHYHPDVANLGQICPLHTAPETIVPGPALPYATHEWLIDHANECLEILDHEYSAKGGLLAILPKKEDKKDREKAETTLLGQLILYVQRLVQRLHDLERLYANSMDALAGEAVVPHQALSALGPDGRKGREMVFPQDRFVLVNAGEDVWQFLNSEFEHKEQIDVRVAQNYKKHGVAGEAIWQQRGGKEMSRGITAIDITTRYYRLRGDPLKTIFVIPAHAEHPGTKATRKMESQPTVVSVVKPVWPERVSQWEMKHRKELSDLKAIALGHRRLTENEEILKAQLTMLKGTKEQQAAQIRHLMEEVDRLKAQMAEGGDSALQNAQALLSDVLKRENAVTEEKTALETAKQAARDDKVRIEREIAKLDTAKAQWHIQKAQLEKVKSDAADAEIAAVKIDLHNRLLAAWRAEIKKVYELKEYFERKKIAIDTNAPVTKPHVDLTEKEVDQILKNVEEEARRAAEAREVMARQGDLYELDAQMGGT